MHPISTLNRDFEDILLKACLKLGGQEKADCSYFIGAALGIVDRRVGDLDGSQDALSTLSEHIVAQLESGVSPPWRELLARVISDERHIPIGHETLPFSKEYASKWIAICSSMDKQDFLPDWEMKNTLSKIFSSLMLADLDAKGTLLHDESRVSVNQFLMKNRDFLDFSFNNLTILAQGPGGKEELRNEDWKKGPANLKKFDAIALSPGDLRSLEEYFNSWKHTFLVLNDSDQEEAKLTPDLLPDFIGYGKRWFSVKSVDFILKSVLLVSFLDGPYDEEEEALVDDEVIPLDEIRAWIESKITEQFIRLAELGVLWSKEKGSRSKLVLKPHKKTLKSLIVEIYEEKGNELLWIDREAGGGRIRRLGKDEDKESLDLLAPDPTKSKEWLDEWGIPKDPKTLWNNLVRLSKYLHQNRSEDWDALIPKESKFGKLIITQSINSEEYYRSQGGPIDVSPFGLLKNMSAAIARKAEKMENIDLNYIIGELTKQETSALENANEEQKEKLSSWRDGVERDDRKSRDQQLQQLIKGSKSASTRQKQIQLEKDMSNKFGPVIESFRLISDYIQSLEEKPKSWIDFMNLNKKIYKDRIGSSRTRYRGIGKSDKVVWSTYDSEENKYSTPEAILRRVLLDAGLTEEEAQSLLSESRDFRSP